MLRSLGTLKEVGGTREEGLWGQDVLPLSSGQDPDTSGCVDFRPCGNCPEFGGFDCGPRPKVYRWELGGPGTPSVAQALRPTAAKLSPKPCPLLSLGGGWKPPPQADKEVARKAEAALMVPEEAGSQLGWWTTGPGA